MGCGVGGVRREQAWRGKEWERAEERGQRREEG